MNISIGKLSDSDFSDLISSYPKDQVFVLVDENTKTLFPYLLDLSPIFSTCEIIEIESGEENKNIETVLSIWQFLSDNNIRRNALFLNLGGGVITDMGGFIASTYKRGIDFINLPTTLLAMIDAAIGGKTGIDLDNFKNQIGTFKEAKAVYCDAAFLKTLPEEQLLSGFAEALKHGLIKDEIYWNYCTENPFDDLNWDKVIEGSIVIKSTIVDNDPTEKGERKLLNFGHTIGHAIESFMLTKHTPVLHGHAVATGMICEAHISFQKGLLAGAEMEIISQRINQLYPKINFDKTIFDSLIDLMKNDKKNISDSINFSLLKDIGSGVYNQSADENQIKSALSYYLSL